MSLPGDCANHIFSFKDVKEGEYTSAALVAYLSLQRRKNKAYDEQAPIDYCIAGNAPAPSSKLAAMKFFRFCAEVSVENTRKRKYLDQALQTTSTSLGYRLVVRTNGRRIPHSTLTAQPGRRIPCAKKRLSSYGIPRN
jgi:hypothetical protein